MLQDILKHWLMQSGLTFVLISGWEEDKNIQTCYLVMSQWKPSNGKQYLEYYERETKTRKGKAWNNRAFAPKMFETPGNYHKFWTNHNLKIERIWVKSTWKKPPIKVRYNTPSNGTALWLLFFILKSPWGLQPWTEAHNS